jgi:hypothetical protein
LGPSPAANTKKPIRLCFFQTHHRFVAGSFHRVSDFAQTGDIRALPFVSRPVIGFVWPLVVEFDPVLAFGAATTMWLDLRNVLVVL